MSGAKSQEEPLAAPLLLLICNLLISAKFSLSHAAISAPQLLDCEALLASL
jgi:hypothetical protein